MRTSTRLTLAYAGLAAVDSWLAGSRRPAAHRLRRATKPLLMPTLAASLATDPRATGSPLRTTTLIAQLGGWGGDVALLGDRPRDFERGSASFAVGHVAYTAGFLRHRDPAGRPGPRPVAALWLLTAPGVAHLAAREDRRLGFVLLGYSSLLAGTVAASTQLDRSLPASSRRLSVAGAALFMTSDAVLGLRRFVLRDAPPRSETVVMATYTAAQLLLRLGAARAGRVSRR
ncbi:lysoplasmalogenase [Nocardioides coralli]|uniref:lysoplasmalogenase n=1 Tax=Nocardioides coralli TaxID=2872154 RepID=UPI001CA42E8D|nr:lysoplasmalogenase [Nocardioides coralli]QZY29663.1 lysoplasmalogenase [Nocardioides coralli]